MTNTIDDQITCLIDLVKEKETMPVLALTTKLFEEGGEFAEASLFECGYLRHKAEKKLEGPFGEAADIINVLFGVLVKLYPEKSTAEIKAELLLALQRKGDKYAGLLNQ